ncbi:MAG: PBP1A family penicillin-binding protein [Deltaproteobacteria bacterium]|nr:PBP1A family penicillin-binding protein [Deltaproteobacteria bacterium]
MATIRGFLKTFSVGIVGVLGFGFVAGIAFLFFTLRGLPDVAQLKNYHHPRATEVFSDDGVRIGEFTAERRYPVDFDRVPRHVKMAFVAAEDSNFFRHGGIDFVGIARAVLSNMLKGRYAQGGSTITQQVARSILLETRKKELTRKIREMVLAWQMERHLNKDEILKLYLDEIYLGHAAFGVGAAARNYFNKDVESLTIAEAAMLAGLPQRPTEWDPFRTPHQTKLRQTYVLKRMAEEEVITEDERRQALGETLTLYRVEEINNKAAPYFTEYVRIYLMNRYGSDAVLRQGFKVYTTVRYDYQKHAEKLLVAGLRDVDKRMGWRGVAQHLEGEEKIKIFSNQYHDEVLDRAVPTRLFPPSVDSAMKRLPFNLSELQGKGYFGNTPIKEGEIERAVVLSRTPTGDKAYLTIGMTKAEMPIAGLAWVKINDKSVKSVSQILKDGDIVDVKIEKIDKRTNTVLVSLEQEPEIQGAMLSFDLQTGFVRSMIGGTDFNRSEFNRALHAKRQVGSTFKPIVYAAAVEKGFSPSTLVSDSPIVFKADGGFEDGSKIQEAEDWRPHNYTNRFEGDIPLRSAIIQSLNIPTVKILNEIGVDYAIQFARACGITAVLPRELTIALGSWSSSLEELMTAFSLFPRLGKSVQLHYIRKVVDEGGKVLEEYVAEPPREVTEQRTNEASPSPSPVAPTVGVSPQTAYVVTDMLRGVVREGTGSRAALPGLNVAGKTGTTSDHRDAWFLGFSPDVITGVWLGYDKDKALDPGESGGRVAAPIWAEYMGRVLKDYPVSDFEIPEGVEFAQIDRATGRLAGPRTEKRSRVAFREGTVPSPDGSNILRIREPGMKAPDPVAPSENGQPAVPKMDDLSDESLRQGYQ